MTLQEIRDLEELLGKLHAHWGEYTSIDAGELMALEHAIDYFQTSPPHAVDDALDGALKIARECLSTLNGIGEYVRSEKVLEISMRGINAIDAAMKEKP